MPDNKNKAPKRINEKPDDENGVLAVLKRGFVELAESGALGTRRKVVEEEKKKADQKKSRGM